MLLERALLAALLVIVRALVTMSIPVDNGVEGEPLVECGPHAIEVTFRTRNPFEGRLFVKGRANQGDCSNEQIGRTFTGITLSFDACGVQRLRTLLFTTKVDRVYHVQCFYMEADKELEQHMQVDDITTSFISRPQPMPVCRYDVLEGGPQGTPLEAAVVGQPVYHRFTCDTESQNVFCMQVHSCYTSTEDDRRVEVLNKDGCALDRHLLNNLEYTSDLQAGQEAHVFKYPDRSRIFFQCQINILLKVQGEECPVPKCDDLNSRNKRLILIDSDTNDALPFVESLDVNSALIQIVDAFDLSPNINPQRPKLHCIEETTLMTIISLIIYLLFVTAATTALSLHRQCGRFNLRR